MEKDAGEKVVELVPLKIDPDSWQNHDVRLWTEANRYCWSRTAVDMQPASSQRVAGQFLFECFAKIDDDRCMFEANLQVLIPGI